MGKVVDRYLNPKQSGAAQPTVRWLAPARLGWGVVTLLTLALITAGVPVRYAQLIGGVDMRPLLELGVSAQSYANYVIALDVFVVLAHVAIAAFIFLRRPNDWTALFVSITLVTNGAILPLAQHLDIPGMTSIVLSLDRLLIFLGLVFSVILLYVFPDGRFVPRGTILLAITWTFLMFFAIYEPAITLSRSSWYNLILFVILFAWAGTGLYAQVFRYQNVSRPIQRQQTKWALLGLFAAMVGPILVLSNIQVEGSAPLVPNVMYQRMGSGFFTTAFLVRLSGLTIFKLGSLLFPLSFAIAVLRYRLWDIDIIIRRTLIYSILTGVLAVIYLSGIVLLQQVFSALTQGSQLAVVVSTLVTAALFTPLRRRIQGGIDRSFFRSRYDAEQILADLSASLRNEVELDSLCDLVLVVVEKTLYPESVSLWLRPVEEIQPETTPED